MTPLVFAAVLAAAALHAGWNALVKLGLDRFPVDRSDLDRQPAWPLYRPCPGSPCHRPATLWLWIGGSAILAHALQAGPGPGLQSRRFGPGLPDRPGHSAAARRSGRRGVAGRSPWPPSCWSASSLLSLGIGSDGICAAAVPANRGLTGPRSAMPSLTACTIAAYTLVDGLGARRARVGRKLRALSLIVVDGRLDGHDLPGLCAGRAGSPRLAGHWRQGMIGGALSLGVLLDRGLGHDPGTDRRRRGSARDQRAVRAAAWPGFCSASAWGSRRLGAAMTIIVGIVLVRQLGASPGQKHQARLAVLALVGERQTRPAARAAPWPSARRWSGCLRSIHPAAMEGDAGPARPCLGCRADPSAPDRPARSALGGRSTSALSTWQTSAAASRWATLSRSTASAAAWLSMKLTRRAPRDKASRPKRAGAGEGVEHNLLIGSRRLGAIGAARQHVEQGLAGALAGRPHVKSRAAPQGGGL